jgi:hypothetical protein
MTASRARYALAQNISTRIVTAAPIAAAVHGTSSQTSSSSGAAAAAHKTSLDTRLETAVHTRDTLSMLAAAAARAEGEARSRRDALEADLRRLGAANEARAATMMGMARTVRGKSVAEMLEQDVGVSEATREQLREEDKEVRRAVAEYRVLKGLAGGVVLASGVDWTADGDLVGLVMDAEEEEEGDGGM